MSDDESQKSSAKGGSDKEDHAEPLRDRSKSPSPEPEVKKAPQKELMRNIFGDDTDSDGGDGKDDELSEDNNKSSEDESEEKVKKKKKSKKAKESKADKDKRKKEKKKEEKEKSKKRKEKTGSEDDGPKGDSNDGDANDGLDEDVDEAPKAKKQKTKKVREEEAVEDNGEPREPTFDDILASMKTSRAKKQEKTHEEMKDDVASFLSKMDAAFMADQEANKAGKPALAKMQMLDFVARELKKTDPRVQEYLVEHGALFEIRKWLDPLPDRSAPNIRLRTVLYDCLDTMKGIGPDHLRTSGIGARIFERSKASDEPIANQKLLKRILERWMRKVTDSSDQYSDLHDKDGEGVEPPRRGVKKIEYVPDDRGKGPKPGEEGFRYRASIPQKETYSFKKMPASSVDKEEAEDKTRKKLSSVDSKLLQMRTNKTKILSAGKVSVTKGDSF